MKKLKCKLLSKCLVVSLLTGLLTVPALPAITAHAAYEPELPSLYQTFNNYFTFGVFEGMYSYFGGDPAKSMLQHHYLSWSPANEFKPSSLFGTSQSAQAYNTAANAAYSSDAERAAAIDKANRTVLLASTASQENFLQNVRNENKKRGPNDQIKIKAHTLLWHNMTPEQFFHDGFSYSGAYASPSVMLDRIDSYIGAVFQKFASYGDVIYSWDVVNEAIDDFTGYIRNETDYQSSNWGRIFKRTDEAGTQRLLDESIYIRQAFASARKYERQLGLNWTLGYNDFFDADKSYEPKRSATVTILKPIYEAGNIDYYGFQGRNATALSLDVFKDTYAMFSTVCNQIQFTESDTRSDLVPNPNYDPNDIHANYYLQDGSVNPNWNRNDIHSPLLIQAPGWQASWANQPAYQKAQADWLADYFDFLLQNSAGNGGKIVMYAVDGLNDSSTFNSNKGCSMFMSGDSSGNTSNTAKMSYYSVIGSKARFELNKKLTNLPDPYTQSIYTPTSWAAYASALDNARNVLKARIYDMNGVNNVNAAIDAITQAINGLTEVATSLSALTVNNEPVKGFSPDTHTYNILTPIGLVPQVAATAADSGAAVEITQASGLPGKAIITVKKDGKQDTYTINFTVDTSLSSIKVNGTQVSGFSTDKYAYSMQVPAGSIPKVQATPNDPGAKVDIVQAAELPGQATVTVSYGSAQVVYTVNFTVDTSLSSLKVNGTTISGFNPGVYSYNALLSDKMTIIPQVQATANDPDVKVAIDQVTAVPGQAAVTVSCGSAQTVYKINFSRNLTGNDEFDGTTLNTSLWHWVNEDPSTWNLASNPGNMTISSRQGDLYGASTDAKNILLQDAPGDWTIETKFTTSIRPHATYEQGGLIAYQDMDNYMKVDWEANSSNSTVIQVLRETNGTDNGTSISGNVIGADNTLWLRLVKNGNSYTAYYSTDGTNFTVIGTSYTLNFNKVQTGLYANNGGGTNTDMDVKFDYFHSNAVLGALLPPVTTDNASADWVNTDQTIQLTAIDAIGGADITYYRVNGGDWTEGTEVKVTDKGINKVEYYSVDAAGNKEDIKSTTVKIDKTAPVIQTPDQLSFLQNDSIRIPINTSDNLSGVKDVQIQFNGQPAENPIVINPIDLPIGQYPITVKVTDNAGNIGSATFTLNIGIDVDHLDELIQAAKEKGLITDSGIVTSLLAKAANVQRVKGNSENTLQALNAMKNEVNAQAGKMIDAGFAKKLLDDIKYLESQIGGTAQ